MNVWLIEPRDPVIFGDGRPFGPTPDARAISLSFPFPSTLAGAVRTRSGQNDRGEFVSDIETIKRLRIWGPLLVELGDEGEVSDWYVQAPSDAVVFRQSLSSTDRVVIQPCTPLRLPYGVLTNLPDGLVPVGTKVRDARKPFEGAPMFWKWKTFKEWLLYHTTTETRLQDVGFDGPVRESRMHVGMKDATLTADDETGSLFQTSGLEFTHCGQSSRLREASRLALAVATDAASIREGFSTFGGERRLALWSQSNATFPPLPDDLLDAIVGHGHCRLVLLTPGHFRGGWKPSRVFAPSCGVTPQIRAAALPRPRVVSGWDLSSRSAKPTRRLCPAGTVYFVSLQGQPSAIRAWAQDRWMNCASDDEQDCRDGFGLAVLGTWDGQFRRLEV